MDFGKATVATILLNIIFFTCVSSYEHSIPYIPGHSIPYRPQPQVKCPKDTLKFGVCGSWLGLATEVVGTNPSPECCTVVEGIADLEAAVCLCTALKANVLGIVTLEPPMALSLLLSGCGKQIPEGFQC